MSVGGMNMPRVKSKTRGISRAAKPQTRRLLKRRRGGTRGGKTRAGSRTSPPESVALWLPGLVAGEKAFGVAVAVVVGERVGGTVDFHVARRQELFARPGMRPKARILDSVNAATLAGLFAGLGHPDRVRIARAVLTGAGSHRELSRAVNLQAGPLYHHLRALERAGILANVSRNLYTLTVTGRVVLLVSAVLAQHGCRANSCWRLHRVSCAGGQGETPAGGRAQRDVQVCRSSKRQRGRLRTRGAPRAR